MKRACNAIAAAISPVRAIAGLIVCCTFSSPAVAVGTAVGTVIENTANVSYNLAGTPLTLQSNTTTIIVAERINVITTLQSAQVLVSPNDIDRALLFVVTNTGNGSEIILFSIDSVLAGDDFDPLPSSVSIYFDTDASGDFNAGDQAYVPGVNDPTLAADESISILILNDIPGTVSNGNIGQSQLTATSMTGSGAPGTVFAGQGDGGVNAIVGATGGSASDVGEYLVSDVLINVVKTQSVIDPFGGAEPTPGATLTYTITVDVASAGVATASVLRDAIPALTTFVANSITLNGTAISDATDVDAGELDTSAVPTVVVRLGDLTQADPTQTIEFQVTID